MIAVHGTERAHEADGGPGLQGDDGRPQGARLPAEDRVPEMEDTSAETVREMMRNGTIAPLNTELVTPMGRPMRMDVFYKVLLPGGRWA